MLQISNQIHEQTNGAFDISVQPLWCLYGEHFLKDGQIRFDADQSGPAADKVKAALALVDQGAIQIEPKRIAFSKPGMQITLNGIAQGYVTDRIINILQQNAIDRVFVDMGESRALGLSARGEPWQVGLIDPKHEFNLAGLIELDDVALATSGAYGLEFDKKGRFHHILDPKTGLSTAHNLGVTVTAPTAAMADGLSTAFSAMGGREIAKVVASYSNVGAIVTALDGRLIKYGKLPKMLTR